MLGLFLLKHTNSQSFNLAGCPQMPALRKRLVLCLTYTQHRQEPEVNLSLKWSMLSRSPGNPAFKMHSSECPQHCLDTKSNICISW